MKIVDKDSLFRQRAVRYSADGEPIMLTNLDKVYEEIDVWRLLKSSWVINLYEVIDDEEYSKLYMIMELAEMGQPMEYDWNKNTYFRRQQVFDYILGVVSKIKNLENLSEIQRIEMSAKWLFYQVANAVEYLHCNNIVHRDIKLDNILVSSENGGCVKVCDFTVAKILEDPDEICYDCEGTPFFTSPEVSFCLKDGYLPRPNDIWAIGVCIHTYLTEELPFNGESDIEVQIATKDQDYKIPDWMGEDLQDLLRGLLDKDPTKRYNIQEVKAHKWFVY